MSLLLDALLPPDRLAEAEIADARAGAERLCGNDRLMALIVENGRLQQVIRNLAQQLKQFEDPPGSAPVLIDGVQMWANWRMDDGEVELDGITICGCDVTQALSNAQLDSAEEQVIEHLENNREAA